MTWGMVSVITRCGDKPCQTDVKGGGGVNGLMEIEGFGEEDSSVNHFQETVILTHYS